MEAGSRPGVLRTPESRFERVAGFPWTPQYLEVEAGLRMAYLDTGPRDAAETPVLLHGEPTWSYLYRKMIAPFEAAGFRVIVPDLIGFGRSDKPVDPESYTYSQHVAWVKRLVAALDLRGANFVGRDWGRLIGARGRRADRSEDRARLVPAAALGRGVRGRVGRVSPLAEAAAHALGRSLPLHAQRSRSRVPDCGAGHASSTTSSRRATSSRKTGARNLQPRSSTSCAGVRDRDRSFRTKRRRDDPGL